jgi:ribosomal 50S subunit-associated protein YjgA (DUF615 family)
LRRALNIALAEANQVDQEDLELCMLASRRLIKASVDLEAQLSEDSAAEKAVVGPCRVDLARAVPVRDKINNAIKLIKKKQSKMALRRAGQAIARAMTAAHEALWSDDLDDVNGVHSQLSKKVEEMEAAATCVDGELFNEANEMLWEAEKTLRKLWRRKQELERGFEAGARSSFSDQSSPGRRNEFSLPAGVQLTGNTVSDLLLVLASTANCPPHHGLNSTIATEAITYLKKS